MKVNIALATHAQQQTEAFKKWFGKSKVVDKEGKPLRVFHGTTASFSAFDTKHLGHGNDENGVGFYFTDNTDWAHHYAAGHGGNTVPVYLKIQKPIYYEKQPDATRSQVSKLVHAVGQKALRTWIKDNFDTEYQGYERSVAEYIDLYVGVSLIDASFGIFNDLYSGTPKQYSFANVFKSATGYDGVIVGRGGSRNYVVFSPTQIKSAVGNKGTFKPRTASITD